MSKSLYIRHKQVKKPLIELHKITEAVGPDSYQITDHIQGTSVHLTADDAIKIATVILEQDFKT